MAGYWLSPFLAFLWTDTMSKTIKMQKINEVNISNIQPS